MKGRVVPRESRQSDVDNSTRRQPRPRAVGAALAMTAGMIGRHRPSISRGSALHDDAGGLLTPRSSALTLAFPGRLAQWRRRVQLPGHSGEDRVGLAPTSRFCIAAASVATDYEAVQLLVVQPSSERTLDPVRPDNFFAEKQESYPARLLVVRRDSPRRAFRTPASGGRAGAVSREAMRERGAIFRQPAPGGDSVPAAGRDGVRKALLGNECLPNRCSCPSVRAVNRWNLLSV